MRNLMKEFRLSARSIPEITEALDQARSRYGGSRTLLFRGRKLSVEAIINAALLRILVMEPEQQEQELREAIAHLERLLEKPTPTIGEADPSDKGAKYFAKVIEPAKLHRVRGVKQKPNKKDLAGAQ
jgi:hypothetical protein